MSSGINRVVWATVCVYVCVCVCVCVCLCVREKECVEKNAIYKPRVFSSITQGGVGDWACVCICECVCMCVLKEKRNITECVCVHYNMRKRKCDLHA